MKVSKIDKLGRIVIPVTYRKQLGINANDNFSIFRDGSFIIISPLKNTCKLCGCEIKVEQKMQLCDNCVKQIKEL